MMIDRRIVGEVLAAVPRQRLLAVAAVLVGVSVAEGAGVIMLLPLLQIVGVDAGSAGSSRLTEGVVALFDAVGVRPTLSVVLVLYVAVAAAQGALQRAQSLLAARLEQDIVMALRRRVYDAIARVEWVFFVRCRSSDFTHVLTGEIDRAGAAAYFLIDLSVSMAIVAVYFAVAFRMSPAVTASVALSGILLMLVMRHRLTTARASGEALSLAARRMYAGIAEHLGSMKTAMSYGAETRHIDAFARLSEDLRAARIKTAGEYGRFRQLLALGSTAGLAVIVYVSLGVLAVPTAELLVLLFVFARLMPRLTGLYEKGQWLAAQLPAFAAVADLERRSETAARPAVLRPTAISLVHEIRLEHVTFDYPGDGRAPALRDVNLTIDAGSTTAIVGPSGAGKSTIADVLMGLLAPAAGRLMIDGRPLGPDGVESWRAQIGYVPQDTFLFHDTVRANLLWARPEATDDDLWEAVRLAAAEPFVTSLPAGLDTILGDRGVLVSGGERQRLSLARALLRRPRVLILDEATSSLDSENEARIQQAIDGLHHQMTIVLITHRLSTIRHADLIYVLDQGRVVEGGSWNELSARPGGRFHDLWQAQGLSESWTDRAALRERRRLEAVGE